MDPNTTNYTYSDTNCPAFDPYWIYAISVPFFGVIFNGILLFICFTFRRTRFFPSFTLTVRPRATSNSASCPTDPGKTLLNNRFSDSPADIDFPNRPEFALNLFVANCAIASVLASILRTITTGYFFSYHHLLCPSVDYRGAEIIEILVYVQYSVFNVAYLNFLIGLNMEKLLFVLKPLHYQAMMTRSRVSWICVITWVLSLAWFPLYFAQSEEAVLRWATILVTILMVGPSVFCLISSAVLAVVVFRLQMEDRRKNAGNRTNNNKSCCCTYFILAIRLFQGVLWTCVTSLPHPLSIIIAYYANITEPAAKTIITIFIGYLSIAYFSGIPLVICLIYPVYWRQFKNLIRVKCGFNNE